MVGTEANLADGIWYVPVFRLAGRWGLRARQAGARGGICAGDRREFRVRVIGRARGLGAARFWLQGDHLAELRGHLSRQLLQDRLAGGGAAAEASSAPDRPCFRGSVGAGDSGPGKAGSSWRGLRLSLRDRPVRTGMSAGRAGRAWTVRTARS